MIRLLNAGWFVKERTVVDADGLNRWEVIATRGGLQIEAPGADRPEAWTTAVDRAQTLGLLSRAW